MVVRVGGKNKPEQKITTQSAYTKTLLSQRGLGHEEKAV